MNKSETIGALTSALSKLQGEIQNTHKDKQGYGYRYTTLDAILDMVRPLLTKYELAIVQATTNDAANPAVVGVEGVLLHSSGEWISSTLYMPVEPKKGLSLAQCSGVVISYIRRYQIAALLGIAQTDNDAATEKTPTKVSELYRQLLELINEKGLEHKVSAWQSHFNVSALALLNELQLKQLINKIEES